MIRRYPLPLLDLALCVGGAVLIVLALWKFIEIVLWLWRHAFT